MRPHPPPPRRPTLLSAVLALAFVSGCCRTTPPFVPVREAIYRSEVATTNRLALPLTSEGRQRLMTFLSTGRNSALDRDATLVDPAAELRYRGLLDLLSQPEVLKTTNLLAESRLAAGPLFAPWFPGKVVRQIVDAHENWPVTPQPIAFLDESKRHWWIFYHRRQTLTHLMVTLAPASKMER